MTVPQSGFVTSDLTVAVFLVTTAPFYKHDFLWWKDHESLTCYWWDARQLH